jgi:hypothetical protein
MYRLTDEAFKAWAKALDKGVEMDSLAEIVDIIQDQEIVTYASVKGQVSFDVGDLVEREVYDYDYFS